MFRPLANHHCTERLVSPSFLSASCIFPIAWLRFRSDFLFLHNGPTIPLMHPGPRHTRPARHSYLPEFVNSRPLRCSYQSFTVTCSLRQVRGSVAIHLLAQTCTQLRIARMVPPFASAPSLLSPTCHGDHYSIPAAIMPALS